MLTQVVAGRTYSYSHSVGWGGGSGTGFTFPVAAALGTGGLLYMINRGSESFSGVAWNQTGNAARISMVTPGNGPGDEELAGEFSTYGDGEGEFSWGTGIAVDGQQNVYLTDEWLDRVSVFDRDGKFLHQWNVLDDGEEKPYGASGLVIDVEENLYIVGGRSHQVSRFSKDGRLLARWGSFGDDQDQLNSPWGIALDQTGNLYVADHLNHRVQKFSRDGAWLAHFGNQDGGRGQLSYPTDVAVDSEGDVYVCDWTDNGFNPGRVQIFDPEGKFITSLTGDAQTLSKWGQEWVDVNPDVIKARRLVRTTEPEWRFAMPRGLVFDVAQNRLLVLDTQRCRIQIYDKLKHYDIPQLNL
jgi:DNA-binding beta-propeller fold protein YncE